MTGSDDLTATDPNKVDAIKLSLMLADLRLPTINQLWKSFAKRADAEGWTAARFLAALAEHELAERDRRRIERHLREARLLPGKSLASFDFKAVPMLAKAQVMALAAGDGWLNQGANCLVFGPPGAGKSHLASAIGLALVENGYRVLFTRTTDLVQRLQVARRELALESQLARLDTATARARENYRCTITASCKLGQINHTDLRRTTSITVPFVDLDDVQNCRGVLTRGMCRPTRIVVRVSYARTEEAEGATLNFWVTLSEPFPETVTLRYRTSDESATAGLDYLTTAGVLAFAPGETSKIVSVPVLDDDLDEWPETVELWISDPNVPEATMPGWPGIGTIVNSDSMPKAWIARFGRTVADQVLDAVDDRMQAQPAPGVEARLAGQRIGSGPAFSAGLQGDPMSGEADASGLVRPMSGRELLPGTSFSLTAETHGEGFVSIWGRGAATRFSGRDVVSAEAGGDVAVDGEGDERHVGRGLDARALEDRAGGHAQPGRWRLPG